MNMNIRPIDKNDYPGLISIFKEFATFQQVPEKMINTVGKMNEESELVNGFVVETSTNDLVGYATYFYAYYTWIGKSMYMDDLFVKPKYRGHGYGRKLIEAVINKAKAENCKKLHWQVSAWNKNAIKFYRQLGAEIDEVESNCDYWL